MAGNTVYFQAVFFKGIADFLGGLESRRVLEHVVAGLRSGGSRALRVREKILERFCAVLGAFDGRMENGLAHRGFGLVDDGLDFNYVRWDCENSSAFAGFAPALAWVVGCFARNGDWQPARVRVNPMQ